MRGGAGNVSVPRRQLMILLANPFLGLPPVARPVAFDLEWVFGLKAATARTKGRLCRVGRRGLALTVARPQKGRCDVDRLLDYSLMAADTLF